MKYGFAAPLNYFEQLLILASTVTACVLYFCICFIRWHCYSNYMLCSSIKNLCNRKGYVNYQEKEEGAW